MIDKHFLKLRARDEISGAEEAAIRSAVKETVRIPADGLLVRARQRLEVSTILLSGIAARQKIMRDGKRQITELHVPGDFVDVHGFTLKSLDHDIIALSECSFAVLPHPALQDITERFPHLTRVYWFGTNMDGAIHREWELSLGSRSAIARMAHLFCELEVRLEIVGMAKDGVYDFPVTQQELADMLGITPVHANRTLQDLRSREVVEFSARLVTIKDRAALRRLAEFDPAYLYLERNRR